MNLDCFFPHWPVCGIPEASFPLCRLAEALVLFGGPVAIVQGWPEWCLLRHALASSGAGQFLEKAMLLFAERLVANRRLQSGWMNFGAGLAFGLAVRLHCLNCRRSGARQPPAGVLRFGSGGIAQASFIRGAAARS